MEIEDAEGYERALLASLHLSSENVPWASWSRAYVALSDALTKDRDEVLGVSASGELGDSVSRVVAALVFGGRTFVVARRLLTAYPPPSGTFVELGAGCGPFGLAAAIRGHPVELRDVAHGGLAMAPGLYRAADLPEPKVSLGRAEALSGSGYAAIAIAYALNEMMAQSEFEAGRVNDWISSWLSLLGPGGRLYLLEPGTKAQGRRLQTIRDQWRSHILAPCPQLDLGCPLNERPRDWCHLTWAHDPGPATRKLAQMSHREATELHFSWLVLSKEPRKRVEPGMEHRLLELRHPDRHKLSGMFCSPQGDVIRVTAQKRDEAAFLALAELQPGNVVELETTDLEAKGDGLRLRDPVQVRLIRPL